METKKRGKLCAVWISEDLHKELQKLADDKGTFLHRMAENAIKKGIEDDQTS